MFGVLFAVKGGTRIMALLSLVCSGGRCGGLDVAFGGFDLSLFGLLLLL